MNIGLLDLFFPPSPPKPENVSRVHEFFGKQIPPVNADRLTHGEYEKRERERKKRKAWKG